MTLGTLKTKLRDAVPTRFQVPLKYYYNKFAGTLEPEMDILSRLVRPGDRVVDVGGNRGTYAFHLWRLGAQVETFEPNPACAALLAGWARRLSRVTVRPFGLSSEAGEAVLSVPVDGSGVAHDASGTLEATHTGPVTTTRVEIRTLDSFAFADVRFIKIDVEGHELGVIQGATETIRAHHPAILVEIEQRHLTVDIQRVFDAFSADGYQGYFYSGGRLHELSEFSLATHQVDTDRGGARGAYVNNFLFLHDATPARRRCEALIDAPRGSRS